MAEFEAPWSNKTSAPVDEEVAPRVSEDGWTAPRREIFTDMDLRAFKSSDACNELVRFVRVLNESAMGKTIGDMSDPVSPSIHKVVTLLSELESWIAEIPPIEQPMRFGNRAFRDWHARLVERGPDLVKPLLQDGQKNASMELVPYLLDSFGNPTRIDYGTGHETTFISFLYCISKLGQLGPEDASAIVLCIFARYMRLMRALQTTYLLEPAGSHGVWGLDDYHCLPFLFGSAQLVDHSSIVPSTVHDDEEVNTRRTEYLYLDCIGAIKEMKTGAPFSETSPMLHSISQLPNWRKVNTGMLKLYDAEVLSKLPVIQHFLFGRLIPCTWRAADAVRPAAAATSSSSAPPSSSAVPAPDVPNLTQDDPNPTGSIHLTSL
uniref:Serine/threonine-protein phosphatase 2A activator n=1 Tax=Rhizochromulina marina TaxID=1034831 RepID=A0A7S2S7E8_9STRA